MRQIAYIQATRSQLVQYGGLPLPQAQQQGHHHRATTAAAAAVAAMEALLQAPGPHQQGQKEYNFSI
jgi:hypothetical protein